MSGLQFVLHSANFDDPISETNETEEPKQEETEESKQEKEKQIAELAEHDRKVKEYSRLREQKIYQQLMDHEARKFNVLIEEAKEKGEMVDPIALEQKHKFDVHDMKTIHKQAQEQLGEGSSKKRSANDAFSGKP